MTSDARNTRVASLTHWRRRSVMQLATTSWGRDVLFGVNTGPEYVIIRTTYVGLIVTSRGRVTTSTRIARQAKSEYNAFSAVVFLLPREHCVVVEIETCCLSLTHWNLCAHRAFVLAVSVWTLAWLRLRSVVHSATLHRGFLPAQQVERVYLQFCTATCVVGIGKQIPCAVLRLALVST
jgi:hypothetical protein